MVALRVFLDLERDARGWVGQKRQFHRDVTIEQRHSMGLCPMEGSSAMCTS